MKQSISDNLHAWLNVLKAAGKYWSGANAFAQAGSLAFFTLFSIAPLVIVMVSISGLFLGEDAARGQIAAHLEATIGHEAAVAVEEAVERSRLDGGGVWSSLVGILVMLIGASTVFGQMQSAMNQIWEVAPKPSRSGIFVLVRKRLLSLAIVLAIGFVMLVSMSLSVAVNAVVRFAEGWLPFEGILLRMVDLGLGLFVISALFAVLFRNLPDVRLRWRDVALGAMVTGILFSIGRYLIALYLTHTAPDSAFGAAGSLVLLMLWVNYSSLILLFGAAFTRAWLEAAGHKVEPRSVASRVRREWVEES